MINQNEMIKKLKMQKLEYGDFSYSDISQMINISIGSLYNWLNGQYKLSQSKAKILNNWLSERE